MSKEQKLWLCINAPTMRELVKKANELGITKEDFICMQVLGGLIYLHYYK